VLPEAKAVLFVASAATGIYDEASIDVQSLETGTRKTLQRGAYFGHYLPSGHLIYMRQGVLFAAPLDLDRLELYGTPVLCWKMSRLRRYRDHTSPFFPDRNGCLPFR